MKLTLELAISRFGVAASQKLSNPSAKGEPEDQLRAPFEQLLGDLAFLSGFAAGHVTAVGETSLSDLKTRPDYSVTVLGGLVGFVELKAPGKGANPPRFRDAHDKSQWEKLRSLPNLLYSDGNQFSLWQNGELVDAVVVLGGDVATSGDKLTAPDSLLSLFGNFLRWKPIPPKTARELAHTSARLCRLLRDEVIEQLERDSPALTSLAADWRKLLFPDATDARFADGYAQALTFGLLMARAKKIPLAGGLQPVAAELARTNSLIGAALRLLTDNTENQATLKTSLGTLTRVLDEVSWSRISKGNPDAWLYFYEDFLEVYDNDLRKLTGSYYTPPEVVGSMVRLVDEALRSPRFRLHAGLASPSVNLADPATGTGTFILGVLRHIAATVGADEGGGSVSAAVLAAVKRLIAFEMQLGPFAVAQLRILAEIVELTGKPPAGEMRMFVTNTLGNPNDDEGWIPGMLAPIAHSRKQANKIKRDESITVVIGNPPYKEKAKGLGGWIEGEDAKAEKSSPLSDWMPPKEWKQGAHSKHLRNLYIYFWRWATRKVFDHGPGERHGIVCYITVAGFLSGPGFQKMRYYLRRTCDDIWVIDCSPEGHQPEVNTRIFQGVQQPVCIVLASRSASNNPETPAAVRFRALPDGHRREKFTALSEVSLDDGHRTACPADWRAPFLPASTGAWAAFPKLEDLFLYNGSGVMPGRTWIIAPDPASLEDRWNKLIHEKNPEEKEKLFHPHLLKDGLGDRHTKRVVAGALAGFDPRPTPIADEQGPCSTPLRYGFRSFDRQWIIPDNRLINRPNPTLWEMFSNQQIYITALSRLSPSKGPALSLSAWIPDLDHYSGRGGRVLPLWSDATSATPNLKPALLEHLSAHYGKPVGAEDLFAYIAAVAAHPAYTARFQQDLSTPGLRIPLTADAAIFTEAAALGRSIIWLHTYGERMADAKSGRPPGPPRLPAERRPTIPADGAIPPDVDEIGYDAATSRLLLGTGYVANVPTAVWDYEVSGKKVITQWFSYRRRNRERPMIGDRRPPSPLGDIQPGEWTAEYTSELLNMLNVLGLLVDLESQQAGLLDRLCAAALITADDLKESLESTSPSAPKPKSTDNATPDLFENL